MKKKFLFSGVAILTLLAMAACTTPIDSSSSGSSSSSQDTSSSSSSSSQTTVTAWTTAQKSVMTSHLEGYVMPYIFLHADATVKWYEEFECVSIESKKAPTTKTTDYKRILTTAGFEFEYDAESGDEYGYFTLTSGNEILVDIYSGEMDDGVYNFICDIYLLEDDGDDGDAGDDYLTAWPTVEIKDYLGEDAVIPEISSDNYLYDSSFEEFGFHMILVIDGAGREEEYVTILEANNWTVVEEVEENYYAAINKEGTIELQFYSDVDDLYILIYKPEIYQAWPQEEIESFLGDLLNSSNEIPVFETDLSWTFGIAEYETVNENIEAPWFFMYISDDGLNVANSEDVFKASLESNGYTIDDSEYDTFGYIGVSGDKNIYLQFYCEDGEFVVFIIGYNDFYLIEELTSWPTELVEEFVDNDSVVVPAASGEEFIVSDLGQSILIQIPVEDGVVATSAYEALLTSGGWTVTDHIAINAGEEDSEIMITITSETVAGQSTLIISIEYYVIPLSAGIFDFSDESQLIVKGTNSSTWQSGNVSMVVEKNGSQQNVGNGNFYSDPLRLYTNQKTTFTATGQNIASIELVAESASYARAFASATWTNATAVASGTTVTITPTTTTNTISFVLKEKAFVESLVVYLS